jgi:hypothetical protein
MIPCTEHNMNICDMSSKKCAAHGDLIDGGVKAATESIRGMRTRRSASPQNNLRVALVTAVLV